MQIYIAAPLYTLALYSVCFILSLFFRLAAGRPLFRKSAPKPVAHVKKPQKKRVYFVADLRAADENGDEAELVLPTEQRSSKSSGKTIR